MQHLGLYISKFIMSFHINFSHDDRALLQCLLLFLNPFLLYFNQTCNGSQFFSDNVSAASSDSMIQTYHSFIDLPHLQGRLH